MKISASSYLPHWFPALLTAVLLAPAAVGQTVPATPATQEKTITLAAFEVSTDRDVGYTASSALAGGRIETLLKETPSAISILTAEFLDDIAATSFSSAAEWAPNSIPVGDTATGGEQNTNIRGVGNSFPSRNYIRWYVSSDSYNTERLEFARGPNSILFGDGNPGGVNTTWTKQALFVPKRSASSSSSSAARSPAPSATTKCSRRSVHGPATAGPTSTKSGTTSGVPSSSFPPSAISRRTKATASRSTSPPT